MYDFFHFMGPDELSVIERIRVIEVSIRGG